MHDKPAVNFTIRRAERADLPRLVEIRNHYITHTNMTFETVESTVEEQIEWFEGFGDGPYQMLVATSGGQVQGSAYSSRYRARAAFDTTVETSISLSPAHCGAGMGTALYTALLQRLARQPVHLAVAGIALPNEASIALHRKLGFTEVGTFREYARKNGSWMSSTWFQRLIEPM
jgi:phosphinothricin acetyltransferase